MIDLINKNFLYDIVNVLKSIFSASKNIQNESVRQSLERLSADNCDLITVKKDQPFIIVGYPADTVWALLSGDTQVVCYSRQGGYCVQDHPNKPQFFGLMEQLDGQTTYSATVVAVTECQLLRIPAKLFMQAIDVSQPLLRLCLDDLCQQAKRIMNLTESQALYEPRDYLAIFLCNYFIKCHEVPCVVHFTRKEIAEFLHINLRSLYRYMEDLGQDGLFTIIHGKICISQEQGELLCEYCKGL